MILHILAWMWCAGCVIGFVWAMVTMIGDREWGVMIVGSLLGIPVTLLIAVFPIAALLHEEGPELATLLKSEWQCSASHAETTTNYVMSGKVMVPITTTTQVCDQYSRGATQ